MNKKKLFPLITSWLLIVLLLTGCVFVPTVELPQASIPSSIPTQPTVPPITQPDNPSQDSSFAIHFIDVGQADAALVLCDGKAMLIDGGNRADSNLVYTYLKKHKESVKGGW